MKCIKLLGTEKDKAKSFYWLITNMNTQCCEKDEFWITIENFKKFRRNAFIKRFKYEEVE